LARCPAQANRAVNRVPASAYCQVARSGGKRDRCRSTRAVAQRTPMIVQAFFELVNDEGAAVALGHRLWGYDGTSTYFCGRRLGKEAIPGSDGQCGPNNGPQCQSCLRFQARLPSRPCPNGHGSLEHFITDRAGFVCDLCSARFPAGSALYGCRKCDGGYDECRSCHTKVMAALATAAPELGCLRSTALCYRPQLHFIPSLRRVLFCACDLCSFRLR
jgi:hypothetical protein